MSSYFNIFGGSLISPSQLSYSAITLSGNITLYWPSQFVDTPYNVANIMDINPTAGGFSVTMPDATQTSVGQTTLINNVGAHSFTVKDNAGGTIVVPSSGSGNSYYIYLIDNTTAAGEWRVVPFSGGSSVVTQVALEVTNSDPSSNNLTVSGSPITSSGTFVLDFAGDLLQLISFGSSQGYAVRTAANTWALRRFTGTGNQIVITYPQGIEGDTNIGLASNITGLTSIRFVNMLISGDTNTISAVNNNSGITLTTTGSGTNISNGPFLLTSGQALYFSDTESTPKTVALQAPSVLLNTYAIKLPVNYPLAGQALTAVDNSQLTWSNLPTSPSVTETNSIAIYSNDTGTLGDSPVIIDQIVGGSYIHGTIGIPLAQIDVANLRFTTNVINATNSNGGIVLVPNGTGVVGIGGQLQIASAYSLVFSNITYTLGFKAPSIIQDVLWTLPQIDAVTANAPLVSDAAGNLSFSSIISLGKGSTTTGQINFLNSLNNFAVTIQAGNTTANTTYTLPDTDSAGVLQSNGSGILTWVPASTGTVTSVTTGSNLTGGPITSSGTISLSSALSGLTSIGVGNLTFATTNVSSSGAIIFGTNGSNVTLTLNSANPAAFTTAITTTPGPSVAGPSVPDLAGTTFRNTLGYDIVLTVYISIVIAVSDSVSISAGVASSSGAVAAATQTLVNAITLTVSSVIPVTLYIPNNYWAAITETGGTGSVTGQIATPV